MFLHKVSTYRRKQVKSHLWCTLVMVHDAGGWEVRGHRSVKTAWATGDSVLETGKSSKSTSTGYSAPTQISKETHFLVQKSKIYLSIINSIFETISYRLYFKEMSTKLPGRKLTLHNKQAARMLRKQQTKVIHSED